MPMRKEKRLQPRLPRQFVDETFVEEASVAVCARTPDPGAQSSLRDRMLDGDRRDCVGRHRAGDRAGFLAGNRRRGDPGAPADQALVHSELGREQRTRGGAEPILDALLRTGPDELDGALHARRHDHRLLDRDRLHLRP
jgi:hypothetical protein